MSNFRWWRSWTSAAALFALLAWGGGVLWAQLATAFTVTATPGTTDSITVPTGPVLGGEFTITAPPALTAVGPPTLNSVTIEALGSGNDATAYNSVALYEDTNNNQVYDQGVDAVYGTPAVAFPTNNGMLTFTQNQVFTVNQVRRYLIVVEFNATPTQDLTFHYRVWQVTTTNALAQGLPSAVINGFFIIVPNRFMFADASATAALTAWLGSTGNVCQTFTIEYQTSATSPDDKPPEIYVKSQGTADESTDVVSTQLWWDSDNSGDLGAADTLVATHVFTVDDGVATFSFATHPLFVPSELRRYFVAYNLNFQASQGETFQSNVIGASNPSFGATNAGFPAPSPFFLPPGLVVGEPGFTFADAGPAAPVQAFANSIGNVCQAFTIAYAGPAPGKPTSVNVTGQGTGNEAADLTAVQFWHDSDQSGTFGAADAIVHAGVYLADDGTIAFDFFSQADFAPSETRLYFVVYDIDVTVAHQATFQCFVSGAAVGGGLLLAGLPAPAGGSAGLVVTAAPFTAQLLGPAAPVVVNNTTAGATGDGEVLLDFSLVAAAPFAWSVGALEFAASGNGDADAALSALALFEDSGNGVWDGAAMDPPAAAAQVAFTGGAATFALSNTAFLAGVPRRFFLTASLNGTALGGQTFGASLQGVVAAPIPGGVLVGIPTTPAIGMQVDGTALHVSAGPNQPPARTHKAGMAATYTVGQFRLRAVNGPVTVTVISLDGAGSGDWTLDVDASAGVELHLDDGDGVFGAGDTLLFQGAGGTLITAALGAPLAIPNNGQSDIWIRVGLADSAGNGVAATPETFSLSANLGGFAVSAGVNVLQSTPLPATVLLGAIEFRVDAFTPVADRLQGGAPITVTGSGFMSPFVVTIGGVPCPGVPLISAGTQVTGLVVPAGMGADLAIAIQSGSLAPEAISETFTYQNVASPGESDRPGCIVAPGTAPLALLLVAVLARRRRRQRY